MAAEVGHLDLAYDYFAEAALMDLDDLEHNTRDGIHIASVAGTWIAAVAGFGGMRDHGGELTLHALGSRGADAGCASGSCSRSAACWWRSTISMPAIRWWRASRWRSPTTARTRLLSPTRR